METPRGWPAKEDRQSSGGNEDHFALDHCSMCTHIRDPHTRWLQLVILTHRPCRERDATLFLTTRPPTPCRRMLNHQSLPQTSSPPSAASQNRKRQHSFHIHTQTDTSNSVRHPSPPLLHSPRGLQPNRWIHQPDARRPMENEHNFHCVHRPAIENNRKCIIRQHLAVRQLTTCDDNQIFFISQMGK